MDGLHVLESDFRLDSKPNLNHFLSQFLAAFPQQEFYAPDPVLYDSCIY
jgi:hypothetical protein